MKMVTVPGVCPEGEERGDDLAVAHHRGGVQRRPARPVLYCTVMYCTVYCTARPGLLVSQPRCVRQDDVHHRLGKYFALD